MPGGDATGPQGQGSQTGRGLGKCNPSSETKENFLGFGRGMGRGGGRGRGIGLGRFTPTNNTETSSSEK